MKKKKPLRYKSVTKHLLLPLLLAGCADYPKPWNRGYVTNE